MNKMLLVTVLVGIIIGSAAVMIMYKDTIFQSKAIITYPDGCNETYINSEITSPICEMGRQLEEEQQNKRYG